MAKLYISEFSSLGLAGGAQIAAVPPIVVQVVDFTAGATSSNAFNGGTRYVRLSNDTICSLRFDGSAATTNYPRSPADTIEYYGVQGGAIVSAIVNS
jgi:hypothetical protein